MKVIAALFMALLLLACTGSGRKTSGSQSPPGLQTDQSIDILGQQRTYHLFLPESPDNAQVVFLLHGNRGSSDQILGLNGTVAPYKIWMNIAERENLILVVPNGEIGSEGHQGWNDRRNDAPTNPTTDDVMFINTLIDNINTEYTRTDSKVFVVGTSNGGIMSMRLADEIPERLHAFAAVVASRPVNTQCVDAVIPVSALIMNGTDDPILPYEGGHIRPTRGELFSTTDAVAYWVNRNQTNTATGLVEIADRETNDNSVVKLYSFRDGLNNTQVRHYEVVGGGHAEPSIAERYGRIFKLIVGKQNNDIEMAEEIWSFFVSL